MRIGELVKQTGLTASRIRYYESIGLIRAVERKANGFRHYPPETAWILDLVTGAQNAGFSLDEIRRLLPTGQDVWRHDELLAALKGKLAEIEALQKRLAHTRRQLRIAIEGIENKPEDLACADNGRRVLGLLQEEEGRAPPAVRHLRKSSARR